MNVRKGNMEMVGGKVSFEQGEEEDLIYWAEKSIKERLLDLLEWNKQVWNKIAGGYPNVIEKTGGKVLKSETDKDEF